MNIREVCILGGGTAAIFTASVLARLKELGTDNHTKNLKIKCVYSDKIGTIGVGESTLQSINIFFKYLGLNDNEWMKFCNATYKISIRFEDFYKKGTYFHYPFGDAIQPYENYLNDWFILKEKYPKIFKQNTFSDYALPHTRMCELNKLTNQDFVAGQNFENNTAYHFDTHLLNDYLKSYCKKRGVEFIVDEYIDSDLDDSGYITKLNCKNNTIRSDIFIDCTGFKSLLLGKLMNVNYVSFSETLINNRVVRAKVPYKNIKTQLKNYTNCFALNNGWCWEIPLWDCMSVGYVHSTKFSNEEQILDEFFNHTKKYTKEKIDYSIVDYKTGRYEKGWVKNVIGVGLSYGFLEPLESTGILTTLHNVFELLDILSKRGLQYTKIDQDIFNYSVNKKIDDLRGFIELHYALSSRDDTDYWKFVTNEISYDSYDYNSFLYSTVVDKMYHSNINFSGMAYLASGMNHSPMCDARMKIDNENYSKLRDNYVKNNRIVDNFLKKQSSTYEFTKRHIYS